MYPGQTTDVNMLIDTTTRLVSINADKFDIEQSSSGSVYDPLNIETIQFHSWTLEGTTASDKLCFTLSKCASNIEFLYVYGITGESYDSELGGTLGLARPDYDMYLAPGTNYAGNDSIFTQISESTGSTVTFESADFATRFSQSLSWIDFGTVDIESNSLEAGPFMTCINDYFWSMGMQGIRIGTESKNAYGFAADNQASLVDG